MDMNIAAMVAVASHGGPPVQLNDGGAVFHGTCGEGPFGDLIFVATNDGVLQRQRVRADHEVAVGVEIAPRLEANIALYRVLCRIRGSADRRYFGSAGIKQPDARGEL